MTAFPSAHRGQLLVPAWGYTRLTDNTSNAFAPPVQKIEELPLPGNARRSLLRSIDKHPAKWTRASYLARMPGAATSIIDKSVPADIPGLSEAVAPVGILGKGMEAVAAGRRFQRTMGVRQRTAHAKQELARQQRLLQSGLSDEDAARTLQTQMEMRKAVAQRKAATLSLPESSVDLVRYTAVGMPQSAVSVAQMVSHSVAASSAGAVAVGAGAAVAAAGLGMAASVFGVVAGGLQVLSGLVKLRAARKSTELARINLERAPSAVPANGDPVLQALELHVRQSRRERLQQCREKTSQATVETVCGALLLGFSAATIVFWPMAIPTAVVALAYGGYRVSLTLKDRRRRKAAALEQLDHAEFMTRVGMANAREKSGRLISDATFAEDLAFTALRQQEHDRPRHPVDASDWDAFLTQCGIANEEIAALRAMIRLADGRTDDLARTRAILHEMLLGVTHLVHSTRRISMAQQGPASIQ